MLKHEASAKPVFTEAFVGSTTAALSQRLTQPTPTDTTLTATPKCPYEQF